jgi:serine/threonine-protein kinase
VQQIGRYQIIERLGRGAMGVVYKALDPRIGRSIAVKSIRLAEISDASELKRLRDRLEREARSAGALSHRNIVAIYDILEEEKLVHLFMEYVNGPSLEKLLSEGKLPEKEMLLNFLRQIASALDYAHKIGIVHRDVKPSNLLVHFEHATGEQIAKVTDFGVAKFISQQMTQAGSMMGTPNYMAPEQIEGAQITGRADQFALAAVAYELLCGEKPFVADYIPTLFFRIVREDPKAADQVNPSLSPAINRALQKGLAKSATDRFESCTAFINALSEALDARPEWAPPYRMEPVVVPLPVEPEPERNPAPPSPTPAFGPINDEPERTLPLGQSQAALGDLHAQTIYAPSQPDTTEEEPKPQGPVILPYDLPYRLPELRRGRNEDGEAEGLPLWRKVAIAALICGMVAIGFAVYRNFTGSGAAAGNGAPASATPETSPATEPNALGSAQSSPGTPGSSASALPSTQSASSPTAPAAPVPTAKQPSNPLSQESAADKALRRAKTGSGAQEAMRKQHLPSSSPMPVQFSSEPSGAHVVVDNNEGKSCSTPCSIPLAPGRHTLTIAAANYGLARRIIEVPDQRDVFVPMSQNIAVVQLDSVPSGSTVYIDGRLQGQTPATLKLTPGPHQVRLTSGNRSLQQTIQVSAESLQSFVFRWQ